MLHMCTNDHSLAHFLSKSNISLQNDNQIDLSCILAWVFASCM